MTDPLVVGAVMVLGLIVLLAVGAPVSVSIGLPSACCLLLIFGPGRDSVIAAQQMFSGVNSFVLLAIPFFILAGVIMNNGGIAQRLVDLARIAVGRMPASLAHTNIVANTIFGSVSGSAVAAAAAIGSTMGPMQRREGYERSFSTATNVASAPGGMLIPPSNLLIVYALAAGGTSVSALFVAGYVPGLLWAIACSVVVFVFSRSHPELRGRPWPPLGVVLRTVFRALPSLGLIVIVIGGIVAGFFTPTEGAAVAVVYALVLSFAYRTVSVRDLPGILYESCRTSAVIIFLIAAASVMSYVMAYARMPEFISENLFGWTDSPVLILVIMMVALLLIGIVLDATPAILIFTPIFLPVALEAGVDPVHFGIMMVFNLSIGVISPPAAPVLFVGAQVASARIESVIRRLGSFYLILVLVLLLVVFVPDLSLALPRLFGLI